MKLNNLIKNALWGCAIGTGVSLLFGYWSSHLILSSLASTPNNSLNGAQSYFFWKEFLAAESILVALGFAGGALLAMRKDRYPKSQAVKIVLTVCIALIALLTLRNLFYLNRTDFDNQGWRNSIPKSDRAQMILSLFHRYNFARKAASDIKSLLGAPDVDCLWIYDKKYKYHIGYDLGHELPFGLGCYGDCLIFYGDDESKIAGCGMGKYKFW